MPKPDLRKMGQVATLVGPDGDQFVRSLAAYFDGQIDVEALGPACEIDPDGVLRVVVDRASYEAVGLHEK